LPSQVPSSPQVETALFGQTSGERGTSPVATKEQVPGAETVLHDLQVSVQALLQQTPSTQKPLAHSAPHAHAAPLLPLAPPSRRQAAPPPPSCLPDGPGGDEWQETTSSARSAKSASKTSGAGLLPSLRAFSRLPTPPGTAATIHERANGKIRNHRFFTGISLSPG
jgi:hypothetical protein